MLESIQSGGWPDASDEVPYFGDLPDAGKRLHGQGANKWSEWQRQKEPLAAGLETIGQPDRAKALRECGHRLIVHRYEKGQRVAAVAECRQAVCPTGMRARALRSLRVYETALETHLTDNPGMVGLFVTLTLKSCASHELKATVDKLIKKSGELMQRVAIKRAVHAWVRSIEVTRNASTSLWHAHVHVVWLVDRDKYFKRNSPLFITHAALQCLWRKQLSIEYAPVVDIRRLRGVESPLSDEGRTSLREVLKYILAPASLLTTEGGKPVLIGASDLELFDDGDGQGLRPMRCVPLRAFCAAFRSRRLVASSRNLQALDDDDTDVPASPELGRYLCTELYVWRAFGRHSGFFLVRRGFDEPTKGRFAMGP